ncbi:glutathionylspermidine synthase [Paenibacillus phyllosphaerae]|uniref:Glutathionylspermidine synthase n=1 Tax=Paenibacillus phyllosphaerae TaxID=274593 RepID=A0A7W5AXQ8_9BACL|nr:glutathionylspermidine synthase family protein [Paenibacillus phyllosphaerae]MBB3110705.1 glutathionylspermidine synthase [Paenibacillus phyllosphaerae]
MSKAVVFEAVGTPHPNRAERTEELKAHGFGWADLEGEPYWLDQAVAMRPDCYEELREASARLWQVFDKAARFVHGKHDLYTMIGIPEVLFDPLDTLPLQPEGMLSRYARFDFAIAEDGTIKLLELNADTPTGYVEASVATPLVCGWHGLGTVNERMPAALKAAWSSERPEAVACIAYGEHAEDTGTVDMLARHSGLPIRGVDCLALSIDEGVVKDGEGEPIRRMFALYPKEWMGVDDGGEALSYAISSGQLQLFNSIHAVLLQSKGLQALIWGLYELDLLFTEEERSAIARYMLPTYTDPLVEGGYVSKSMFGREGGSVIIYDEQGQTVEKDEDGFDTSAIFPLIYQQRAELARVRLAGGEFHLLVGMFVINGEPCGLLGRAGGLITGNTSHFVAIGVKDHEPVES